MRTSLLQASGVARLHRLGKVALCLLALSAADSIAAPATPTGLSPGSTSAPGPVVPSTTVTLSWSAVSGTSFYDIGVTDINAGTLVLDTTTTSTSRSVTLSAGKPYRWNLRACNSTGCSSFTSLRYFQTPGAKPATPTGLSPGSTSAPGPVLSGTTVTLAWSAVPGTTFYDLGVTDINAGTLVLDTTTASTSRSVTLAAGKPYRWNMRACNSSGCSSFTSLRYFQTPGASPPPPATPTGLSPGSTTAPGPIVSGTTVTLAWSAVSGATVYDLGVTDINAGTLVVDATSTSTSRTVTLAAGKPYRWNLRACNTGGCSGFTSLRYFQTPGGVAPPAAPVPTSPGTTTDTGQVIPNLTPTLRWGSVANATSYQVNISKSPYGTGNVVYTGNTGATGLPVPGGVLQPATKYRWDVTAIGPGGEGPQSKNLYFQAPAASPPACEIKGYGFVNWGVDYTIQAVCTNAPTSWSWTVSSGGPMPSGAGGTLRFPSPGTYTFTVRGTNAMGPGAASPAHTVKVHAPSEPEPPPPARPELSVPAGAIEFSPAVVAVGQDIRFQFTVLNSGTGTSSATTARIQLTPALQGGYADTDPTVHTMEIPGIAAGNGTNHSILTQLPVGISQGEYFVSVKVDEGRTSGQSDFANDRATTTRLLTVQPKPAPAPTVSLAVDRPLPVPEGTAVRFAAQPTGSPPYRYQWLRDGRILKDWAANEGAEIVVQAPFGAQATYQVVMRDASGREARSAQVVLSTTGSAPNDQAVYEIGVCDWRPGASSGPASPIVVVTHGWQPFGDPDDWMARYASSILSAVPEARVCLFKWANAHTASLQEANRFVDANGETLARYVMAQAGIGFQGPIHFIGHSLGSIVNATAVSVLAARRALRDSTLQVTVLDAPMDDLSASRIKVDYSSRTFAEWLVHPRLCWVDNYYGGGVTAVGERIVGAAPSGGHRYASAGHTEVPDEYEKSFTIGASEAGLDGGFAYSIARSTPATQRPSPQYWGTCDSASKRAKALGAPDRPVDSTLFAPISGSAVPSAVPVRDLVFDGWILGAMALPGSSIAADMIVPPDVAALSFDVRFSHANESALSLEYNGAVLSTLPASAYTAGEFRTVIVPITPAAGHGAQFRFTYVGTAGGEATIANVKLLGTLDALPGALAVLPASLDFGGQSMQTTSPAQAVSIANHTPAAIAISGITASPGFSVTHDCASLAPGATCSAHVSFTPGTHGAISGSLTIASSAGTQAVPLAGNGERSLATHYYRSILRRAPDAAGKAFWEAEAARVSALGANVNETWFAMVMSFYGSGEYAAFGRNPTEYVRDLYNTFFNRAADNEGLAFWSGQLAAGMPREILLSSFMFSSEFTAFSRGIFGNAPVRAELDTVMDFYRGLLGRLPDSAGFDFWAGRFRLAQCQGAAAVAAQADAISSAFLQSAEYAGRGRSNSQYVGDLYNAFLRRGGDLGGALHWIQQLDSGALNREQIRRGFVASAEFNARVGAMIAQGCAPP